jgi:hypothetical protein
VKRPRNLFRRKPAAIVNLYPQQSPPAGEKRYVARLNETLDFAEKNKIPAFTFLFGGDTRIRSIEIFPEIGEGQYGVLSGLRTRGKH